MNQYSKTTVIRNERDKQISKADITKQGSSFRQLIHPLQKEKLWLMSWLRSFSLQGGSLVRVREKVAGGGATNARETSTRPPPPHFWKIQNPRNSK